MIDAVLKIVREFLKEQYPDNKFECDINNQPHLNGKTAPMYLFRIDRVCGRDPKTDYVLSREYTWINIFDNRSGANELFRNEIYFRYNNIKNAKILVNQLELLGLILIKPH